MASSVALDAVILGYKKRINQFEISRNVLLNTLYQKYPELLSLRKDYAALRMDARKQKNNDTYKMQYAKVYTAYQALLQSCITKENIPAAHITYHPMCKICGDTGYVGDAEKKHCSCVIANAAQNIMVSSRINDQETLDNFDLSLFDDVTAILKNMTQRQLMKKMHFVLRKRSC